MRLACVKSNAASTKIKVISVVWRQWAEWANTEYGFFVTTNTRIRIPNTRVPIDHAHSNYAFHVHI